MPRFAAASSDKEDMMTDKNHPTKDAQAHNGGETVLDQASHAYDAAREKAAHVVEASRERVRETATVTVEAVERNPLSIVVGGLAVGAAIAAVLPRSARERELLAPVGKKVGKAAAAAFAAAKATGLAELEQRGLTTGSAREGAKSLFKGVAEAASAAGTAGVKAGKDAGNQGVGGEAASNA